MSRNKPTPPLLNVYAPRFPGDVVEIIGRPPGLDRLIHALIRAIDRGEGGGSVRTSDGFSTEIRVACLQGDRRIEDWSRSGSPLWNVDDPLVARILELSAEVHVLRETVEMLLDGRTSSEPADHPNKDRSGAR